VSWWASLVQEEHAGLHDPYGGSQTGTPGEAVLAGKAAMGFNGYFAVGQLNDAGAIAYDFVQPFLATDGNRYSVLSTNGYVNAPPGSLCVVLRLTVPGGSLTGPDHAGL
jgi:hypothetical protein